MRRFLHCKQKIAIFLLVYALSAFIFLWLSFREQAPGSTVLEKNPFPKNVNGEQDFDDENIGTLDFQSGLIHLPVVQGEDNSYYLKHDPQGNYSTKGSLFMDVRNDMDDVGIVIYGHTLYYDDEDMFSPLHRLKDQAVFDLNRMFTLSMRHRRYTFVITHIVDMPVADMEKIALVRKEEDDLNLYREFISYMDMHNLICPSEKLTIEDRYMILFTCIEEKKDDRLLVIGKRVDNFPKDTKK